MRCVRRSVRCRRRRSSRTAAVDEKSRFPQEALDALNSSGFNAIHVPEEFGWAGADSVAACIVIEEVARVDASASLIPAVNKLGTMGLILAGDADLKKKVLPEIADGALASYGLSEREAGSDAASMRTRAKKTSEGWVLNGGKAWITNGGKSTWYTHGRHRPREGRQRHLGVHGAQGRSRVLGGRPRAQARHQGFADRGAAFREL